MKKDSTGKLYCEISNVRITLIKNIGQDECAKLRLQSYRSNENRLLHRGADIYITDKEVIKEMINALVDFDRLLQ